MSYALWPFSQWHLVVFYEPIPLRGTLSWLPLYPHGSCELLADPLGEELESKSELHAIVCSGFLGMQDCCSGLPCL